MNKPDAAALSKYLGAKLAGEKWVTPLSHLNRNGGLRARLPYGVLSHLKRFCVDKWGTDLLHLNSADDSLAFGTAGLLEQLKSFLSITHTTWHGKPQDKCTGPGHLLEQLKAFAQKAGDDATFTIEGWAKQ